MTSEECNCDQALELKREIEELMHQVNFLTASRNFWKRNTLLYLTKGKNYAKLKHN